MRTKTLLALAVVLLPAVALAATGSPQQTAINAMAVKVLGVAKSYWVLGLILGLLIEFFGRPRQPDLGGIVWRAIVVLFLLVYYQEIFGRVADLGQSLASSVAGDETYTDYKQAIKLMMERVKANNAGALSGALGEGRASSAANMLGIGSAEVGGWIFSGFLFVVMMLAMMANWVLGQLGLILTGLFFIIGPLALVFSIPRGTGAGGKWFSAFCTYCTWPIWSAILLNIATVMVTATMNNVGQSSPGGTLASVAAAGGQDLATLLKGLGASLVLLASTLSVPKLSGAMVSAAASNFAGQAALGAHKDMKGWANDMKRVVAAKMSGGASEAGRAAAGAAAGAAGSAAAGAAGSWASGSTVGVTRSNPQTPQEAAGGMLERMHASAAQYRDDIEKQAARAQDPQSLKAVRGFSPGAAEAPPPDDASVARLLPQQAPLHDAASRPPPAVLDDELAREASARASGEPPRANLPKDGFMKTGPRVLQGLDDASPHAARGMRLDLAARQGIDVDSPDDFTAGPKLQPQADALTRGVGRLGGGAPSPADVASAAPGSGTSAVDPPPPPTKSQRGGNS